MSTTADPTSRRGSARPAPGRFVGLTFALSAPFWLLGELAERHELLVGVPVSALMVVCPLAAALILLGSAGGRRAVSGHLRRSLALPRGRSARWWAPAALLVPGLLATAYVAQIALGRPTTLAPTTVPHGLLLAAVFFFAALGEEGGWSGYLTDALAPRACSFRVSSLRVALVVGSTWAVWHYVPLLQVHRSLTWIAWWTLGTLALRVLTVWIYLGSGRSVLLAAVFHASGNLGMFAVEGVYTPDVCAAVFAVAAAVVCARAPSEERAL